MNILYLSCHIVLEYDELRILNDLGHKVCVIGGYIIPKNPHNDTRPPLNIEHNQDWVNEHNIISNNNHLNGLPPTLCGKKLTKEFVDKFDCVIVMHIQDWIEENLDIFKGKLVILRTIGQNLSNNEHSLKKYMKLGIKVLRYSPRERLLSGYAGEHGLIRFLKYEFDFKPRQLELNGNVITFGQSIKQRGKFCASEYVEEISKRVNYKLYGPGNQDYIFNGGRVVYDELLNILSRSAAYFYTGTFPAQYTLNFIEAMMAGIPVVSVGRNTKDVFVHEFPFEVPDILDTIDSLYGESVDEIVNKCNKLLNDMDYNNEISKKQKIVASELFSSERNMWQWNSFFNSL